MTNVRSVPISLMNALRETTEFLRLMLNSILSAGVVLTPVMAISVSISVLGSRTKTPHIRPEHLRTVPYVLMYAPVRGSKGDNDEMIFLRAIKDWVYCPDRFYFFTGANDNHTNCAREELEEVGIIYAEHEIYNYEPDFDGKYTLGLGDLSVLARIRVRFIFWKGGIKGRLWYTI